MVKLNVVLARGRFQRASALSLLARRALNRWAAGAAGRTFETRYGDAGNRIAATLFLRHSEQVASALSELDQVLADHQLVRVSVSTPVGYALAG